MGKGKKRGLKGLVLLSIVVILIVCCFTLAACGKTTDEKNSGTNIEQSEGQGNNSGNQSEIEQGGQTGGQTGGQETGGETGGEVTPDPEKTPAEYKAECEEKITNALKESLTGGRSDMSAVVNDFKVNAENGDVYTNSVLYRNGEPKGVYFCKFTSNLGKIKDLTYKQISEKLNTVSLTNVEKTSNLKLSISEEKYNDLCNYVLADVGLRNSS